MTSGTGADAVAVQTRIGPAIPPVGRAVVLILGTVGMEMPGLQPLIMNALVNEGRLTLAQLGWACGAEFLAIAVAITLAESLLKPQRLRLIGTAAALILLAGNLAGIFYSGNLLVWARGLAGIGEGVLIWIAAGLIARSMRPAFWAAIFLLAQCTTQSLIAVVLPATLMVRYGANAGFYVLASLALFAAMIAPLAPRRFAELPKVDGDSTVPRITEHIIPLLPALLVAAAVQGIFSYLGPLATYAMLPASVVDVAVAVTLGVGIVGSATAALATGRLGSFQALCVAMTGNLAVLVLLVSNHGSVFGFVVAAGLLGFFFVFLNPFFSPFLIEIDPSRRSAVVLPGVQLLGAALGPFVCSFFTGKGGVSGILAICAAALILAFAIISVLQIRVRRRSA